MEPDFNLRIKSNPGPGAVNVGTIDLNPAGFSGFSSIDGGSISGNLTGGLTLVQDSGGAGGELTFTIDGDVSGAVTIPVVNDFEIGGDLSADLTVTDTINDSLVVFGDVASTVTVTINNQTGGSAAFAPLGSAPEFAGDLILSNGVPANTSVKIGGWGAAILASAEIDLKDKAVAGNLLLRAPNSGTIVNGGAVSGTVELATGVGVGALLAFHPTFPRDRTSSGHPIRTSFSTQAKWSLLPRFMPVWPLQRANLAPATSGTGWITAAVQPRL